MRAVHAEYEKNLISDGWRSRQASLLLLDQTHPESRFSIGTIDTLNVTGIRDSLIDFYNRHYSSNTMKLVVVGREPIESLEGMVVEMFSDVPKRETTPVRLGSQPFGKDPAGKMMKIVSLSPDEATLILMFQLPSIVKDYKTSGRYVLLNLIINGGAGGLIGQLRKLGLATSVGASLDPSNDEYAILNVYIYLTQKGLSEHKRVINIALGFVKWLQGTIPESFFIDMQKMGKVMFEYDEGLTAIHFAKCMAEEMFVYEHKDILIGGHIPGHIDRARTKELANYLHPDNVHAILMSNQFDSKDFETEKWFGTKYKIEPLVIDGAEDQVLREFAFPPKNPFIPEDFTVFGKRAEEPRKEPTRFVSPGNITVWHKLDDTFMLPRAEYVLFMRDPAVIDGSAEKLALLSLTVSMIDHMFVEMLHDARLAQMYCMVVEGHEHLHIGFMGYTEKLADFMKNVGRWLADLHFDGEVFEVVKFKAVMQQEQQRFEGSHHINSNSMYLALRNMGHGHGEMAAMIGAITFSQLCSFASSLFSPANDWEALVVGNVKHLDAVKNIDDFVKVLAPTYTKSNEYNINLKGCNLRECDRPPILVSRVVDNNYAVQYYIQIGALADPVVRAMTHLFTVAFAGLVHQRLRTEQALGYIASLSGEVIVSIQGVSIIVQSPHTDPHELEKRISDVLEVDIRKKLEVLDAKEFREFKEACANSLQEKFEDLYHESGHYWRKIRSRTYNFLVNQETSSALHAIDVESFKRFAIKNIVGSKRVLVGHAWPEAKTFAYNSNRIIYDSYLSARSLCDWSI